MKICIGCEQEKSLEDFPSNGRGYFKSRCKPCYNAHTKHYRDNVADKDRLRQQWREAAKRNYNPEKRRSNTLAKYGLTTLEYENMLLSQGGVCKICRRPPEEKLKGVLHVDHCHTTGKVRGLLCDRCNVGIGCFEDDVDRLNSAMLYLSNDAE